MVDTTPASPAVSHPLEPLLADEIQAAVAAVRASGRITDAALFSMVTLEEPTQPGTRRPPGRATGATGGSAW